VSGSSGGAVESMRGAGKRKKEKYRKVVWGAKPFHVKSPLDKPDDPGNPVDTENPL